jgi:ferric-dicitrate binding protein FerR (iron transport regulator)
MLNGNSRIRYKKHWNDDAAREVWLDGEGFFKVIHTKNHRKFVVHTADQVAVEVLGTTFTVAKRKTGTRVVLNSGKVRLNVFQTANPASVDLAPGDLVQVKPDTKEVVKQQVNPEAYSSWTKQVLSFNNTQLWEVVALLEETYGLDIIVSDEALYSRKVSGSTPITKNLNLLFIGLEQAFDLKITRKGNKVLMEKLP